MVFDYRDTLSGVIGSICCVYVGLPFDVIKLRLQTQHQQAAATAAAAAAAAKTTTAAAATTTSSSAASAKATPSVKASSSSLLSTSNSTLRPGWHKQTLYRGPIDCLVRMVSSEGVRALWKGAIPALSSGISENAALFTANDALKRLFISLNRSRAAAAELPGVVHTLSTTGAGTTADVVASASSAAAVDSPDAAPMLQFSFTSVDEGYSHHDDDDDDDETDEELDAIIASYNDESSLTVAEYYLCGGIAGIFSSTVMCPSEVVKVRLQYQRSGAMAAATAAATASASPLPNNVYRGPLDCVVKTVRNEGWRALYKGYSALLMRDVPFNTIFIGSYDSLCYAMCKYTDTPKEELSAAAMFAAGGLSGMIGWSIVFPLDVVKSRMHLLESTKVVPSALRVASNIIKTEGVRALYAGWSAAVMRAFPANAALFLSVELCRRVFSALDENYRSQM